MTQLYQLSMSEEVGEQLRALATAAAARGDGHAFAAAATEFIRRLRIYPQFGDPLIDLTHEVGQIRLGVIPPLSMRYGVLEEHRIVFIAARPVLLAMTTFDEL